jgi:hypothetical protein
MSILGKLKIVPAAPKRRLSPAETRRTKLLAKLSEQLSLAEARVKGESVTLMRKVWVTADDGSRTLMERPKRLRPWFFESANGTYNVSIRYGARVLELAKGKSAIEVGKLDQVPAVIKTVIEAVNAGELDAAVEAVAERVSK